MIPRLRTLWPVALLACAVGPRAQTPEYRASWADAFHTGYLTKSAVTTTVGNLRAGNINVFVPEVYVNKGAQLIYWKPTASEYPSLGASGTIVSNGTQIQCDLDSEPETNSAGSFDPLAESILQCHDTSGGKARLDVWAWLVSFRSAGAVPANHPTWITVNGGTASSTDFDAGHPGVEQQLLNNCLDIIRHYDVDGLNFDYIRLTNSADGFNPVSVARYRAITGNPAPTTGDAAFKQWRRDQITNVVRKIFLSVIAEKPNVKISADTIMWSPAPARPASGDPNKLQTWRTNFESSSAAFTSVLQDWRSWMEEGIIDVTMPMAYLNECTYQSTFDKWCDFTKDNQFGRQAVIGTGGYLNSLSDNLAQYARTRQPSSTMGKYGAGQNNYSYAIPYADACAGNYMADPAGWSAALKSGMYAQAAPVPALPRLTSGKGHVMGTVINTLVPSPGWVDGGTVTLSVNANGSSPLRTMTTDGTGFYGFVDVAPGNYYVKVHAANVTDQVKPVTVSATTVATVNFAMSVQPPATQLAFSTQPGGAATDAALSPQPVVVARDASGSVATSFTGDVTLAIQAGTGPAGAALNGARTVAAVNGVASFSGLSINRPGEGYVLQATGSGLTTAFSAPFAVQPVPSKLAVVTEPSAAKAGQALPVQPVIAVQDAFGSVMTAYTGPVAIAIKAGTGFPGATLSGTTTVDAVNGIATFSGLSIDKVGFAYRLTATSGTLTAVDTVAFDVSTTAVALAFEVQPGGAKAGKLFTTQPVVVARNEAGGIATDYIGIAAIEIKPATGANGAVLDGTATVDFINGKAAFTDLAIADAAEGYMLVAASGALPPADSAAFDVVSSGPFTAADVANAASIAAGLDPGTPASLLRLDVNADGRVDLLDVVLLARKQAATDPNP